MQSAHEVPAKGRRARRVLLAWEMGEGFGHASRLLTLARGLRDLGWTPVVAARNPAALAARYAEAGIPLVATPAHRNCFTGPGRFRAASFADVMGVCGYADAERLRAIVTAWDALLDEHLPELIIADYSPLLSLAAFGRVPLLTLGDGFVTPPGLADGSFPPLGGPAPAVWDSALLLDNARRVQAVRGQRQPESLPEIMLGAAQLTTVPREIDVYADVRPRPAAGPLERLPPPLPPPAEPRVFAYLRMSQPLARTVMQMLSEGQVPGECYLHEATPAMRAALQKVGFEVHAEPPPIDEVLRRASFVIHHGGIGTLQDALAAGRAQLLLPRHLEQALNSRQAVAALPGVFRLSPNATLDQLRERLPALFVKPGPLALAGRTAARVHARQECAWEVLQALLREVAR